MKSYLATHLKNKNRQTVYKLFAAGGEISRAEIGRQTGISSPTVIKISDFLLEKGIIFEVGPGETSVGRRPQMLKFNPEAAFSIGAEFEGDYLRLGIVDLLGNIKLAGKSRVNRNLNSVLDQQLCSKIDEMVFKSGISKDKMLGVGLGIPAIVDPDKYEIETAPLIGILERTALREKIYEISDKLSLPVYIENDVNAAALGEYVTRKINKGDLIYIALGTGLGSGIILDGELRRGKRSSAGEIGYMVFEENFKTSKMHSGWLESLINIETLSDRWQFSVSGDNIKLSPEKLNRLIDYVAAKLGLCIANACTLMDINLAVVGGITTEILGNPLLEATRKYLDRLSLLEVECQFEKNPEPGVVGAASIVTRQELDRLLDD